VTAQVKRDATQ